VLVENVVHLDPASAVFDAMLEGWQQQQQSARFLKASTITPRLRLIRRMERFTGLYPWQWAPADGEAFIDDMRGGESPIVSSTARSYEVTVSLFLEYLLDSRYGWARVCEERFGDTPQQLFHEGNSVLHKLDYEGDPRRRPLTYDEVQALFDAADARPGVIAAQGRKGTLCAARDAAVLKTAYAFGLRRREASRLDLADLRRNRAAPQFGEFGNVMVRYGKGPKGPPPKRRTVLLVPEMDWVLDTLRDWIGQMRPRFTPGSHPALWGDRTGWAAVAPVGQRGVRRGSRGRRARSEPGLALPAALLRHAPDRVRLSGSIRAGASRPRLRVDHRDLHGSVQ
jgi:integrase/recombinase XerC